MTTSFNDPWQCARAIAPDPNLVVPGEPEWALDLPTQARAFDLFIEIQERRGGIPLHHPRLHDGVAHISPAVAVMFREETVETGDGTQMTASSLHPYPQRMFMAPLVTDPHNPEVRRVERRELLDAEKAAS